MSLHRCPGGRRTAVAAFAAATMFSLSHGQMHFASLGSFGRNNRDQKAVAQTLKHNAKSPPLSLIISPGFNFIESVYDLEDKRWQPHFEDIYAGPELNVPFLVALGEEDWTDNVTAMVMKSNLTHGRPAYRQFVPMKLQESNFDNRIPDAESETSTKNPRLGINDAEYARQANQTNLLIEDRRSGPRWTLPNFYYHHTGTFTDAAAATAFYSAPEVSVMFIFIDTFILSAGFPAQSATSHHWNQLRQSIHHASKAFDWVIVVGDKAIYSSGKNGNSRFLSQALRPLLKDNQVDAYISGSDADMEIIEDGSLSHISCGSASAATGQRWKHDGQVAFSGKVGYCLHTLTKNAFATRFVDGYSGKTLAEYSQPRNSRPRSFIDRLFHDSRVPPVAFWPMPVGIGGMPDMYGMPLKGKRINELFVLIVGTCGIVVSTTIFLLTLTTMVRRAMKMANAPPPSSSSQQGKPPAAVAPANAEKDPPKTTEVTKTTTTTTYEEVVDVSPPKT